MCGIYGYISFNDEGASYCKPFLSRLINASTVRGTDATGIGYITDTLHVLKGAMAGSTFIESKLYTKFMDTQLPRIAIGHDRAQTKGEAKDNNNNHPILTGTMALVHNGIISNDEEVLKRYKLTGKGIVDSEVIPLLINHYITKWDHKTAITKTISKLTGSQACALIDERTPDNLYLWRTSSPLTLAYHKATGSIFFASTEAILKQALTTTVRYMGIFEQEQKHGLLFYDMPINTGMIINATGTVSFDIESKTPVYKGYAYTPKTGGGFDVYCPDCMSYHITGQHKKTIEVSPYASIKRPRDYTTKQLESRLHILDAYQQEGHLEYNEEQEQRRIINALADRQNKLLEQKQVPLLN
jgi:hypothetical protein